MIFSISGMMRSCDPMNRRMRAKMMQAGIIVALRIFDLNSASFLSRPAIDSKA